MSCCIKEFQVGKNVMLSAGFTMATKAVLGSLSYLGGSKKCSIQCFAALGASKGPYRETWLIGMALTTYKIIETLFWTAIGLVSLIFGRKEPINLAMRSFVQFIANSIYSVVGFIGTVSAVMFCFRSNSLWAPKLYMWTVKVLTKIDPNIFAHCESTFTGDRENISAGLLKVLGDPESVAKANRILNGIHHQITQEVAR